jgi:peptidoglycan/xylan/chitin deacetylase (PgdA/CDA1 family)
MSFLRPVKAELIARLMGLTGLRFLVCRLRRWSGVVVLNYHRIGDGRKSPFDRGLWSATADDFERQIRYCKAHFDVIAPQDLADVVGRCKGRYVLVTFDDGYKDNYEAAFPVLAGQKTKALFFITTGFIDEPKLTWWDEIAWMVRTSRKDRIELPGWLAAPVVFDEPDRERAVRTVLWAYKQMASDRRADYLAALGEATGTGRCGKEEGASQWMSWDMIRRMRAAGMSIGGHTASHANLGQLTREQQWQEVTTCGRRFAEEMGERMAYFSYPFGNIRAFNADTKECMQKAGVQFAFSYYGGVRTFEDWDPYDIRRVPVEHYHSIDWFRAMVSLPGLFARPRTQWVGVEVRKDV